MKNHITNYLSESIQIIKLLDTQNIVKIGQHLKNIRSRHGRIFVIGVGGSAANASHAVNDLRKIACIEAYSPSDNISELTARINDNGWENVFRDWLKGSHLDSDDGILVLSVGGGNIEKNISVNLIRATEYAKSVGACVIGIVGRDGGYVAEHSNISVIIPTVNPETVTAHSEEFQSILLHLIITMPEIQQYKMKWETEQ
ncbi:MAG: SIS domain-containing protein [Pedobacter sp.]|uniref:SIS domain-containing protein n=1 Tax=Pedobacter sp. TaxID=1411316 RepID=UPI003564DB09